MLDNYINDQSTQLNTLIPKANKQEQKYNSFIKLLEQAINEIADVSQSTSNMLQSLNENPIIELRNIWEQDSHQFLIDRKPYLLY